MIVDGFDSAKYFKMIAKISSEMIGSKDYQKALRILWKCRAKKGTVFTMGCGGSASTASHFAADLAKTTIMGKGLEGKQRFKAIGLVDSIPLVSAWTNDYGWGTVFAEQLEPWLTEKDVLVGFSVHGGSGEWESGPWSQNLVAAMKLAKKRKAKIIGLAGFDGGAMKKMADVCLTVPIDSETYAAVAEAMHVVIHHAIIYDLKEKIKNAKS